MRFKISIYESKKYKASKKRILEFSEFKDIIDWNCGSSGSGKVENSLSKCHYFTQQG